MTARGPVLAIAFLLVVSFASVPLGAAGAAGQHGSGGSADLAQAANATVDGAPFLHLDNAQETISGTTSVAPGTNVTVVVAGGNNFQRQKTVQAGQGTYSASFDFSNVTSPTTVQVDVRANGASILRNGSVAGRIAQRPASLLLTSQTSDGKSMQIRRANLPDGGVMVAHDGGVDGPIVGVSEPRQPGQGTQLFIPFNRTLNASTDVTVVLYRDVNGNDEFDGPDRPYTAEGRPVAASAALTVSAETTTTTTTATTTTTTSGSDTTTTVADDTTTTTTTASGPGFGAFAALLGVLLGSAGLARRRRGR